MLGPWRRETIRAVEVVMFDGQVEVVDAVVVSVRESDWQCLHAEIVAVGEQIASLEARQVELLLQAEEMRLFRRMGFPTIYAYIEAVLGLSRHTATERMRVGHELVQLPDLAAQFRAGELPWASVRELTRVVTPKTEAVWLDAVAAKTSDDVQRMVRGKAKGDLPTDPVDPKKIRHRIVLDDLTEEALMMFKQARLAVGGSCTNDEAVRAFAMAVLRPATSEEVTPPPVQSAVVTCRDCRSAQRVAAGMSVEMTEAERAHALCDCVHIGALDRDEVTRLTSEIPEATRRKVFARDRFQCAVPGCRSCRFLEVHHIVFRENGGTHVLANLTLLCSAHHQLLHDGVISIRGPAPDGLVFELPMNPGEN